MSHRHPTKRPLSTLWRRVLLSDDRVIWFGPLALIGCGGLRAGRRYLPLALLTVLAQLAWSAGAAHRLPAAVLGGLFVQLACLASGIGLNIWHWMHQPAAGPAGLHPLSVLQAVAGFTAAFATATELGARL